MLRRPRASSVERNVHRRRPAILRSQVETRGPRPTPPSRVNGCLGVALAQSTFSLPPLPCGSATRSVRSRGRVPFGTRSTRGVESFCRVTDPRGTARAPNPHRVPPRVFRNAAPDERRGQLRFRNRPSTGGAVPPRRSLLPALLRILADPPLHDPRDLPRRARPRHLPSSTDDLQGWVVPSVSPADPDLAIRCLSLS